MANRDETHLNTDEARSGTTPHVTRYVLIFGLLLIVALFALLLILYA